MKRSRVGLFSVVLVSSALCGLPLALAEAPTAGASGPALSTSATVVGFGAITLGTYYIEDFTVTNTSSSPDVFNVENGLTLSGVGADDYGVTPEDSCPGNGVDVQLAAGDSCTLDVFFLPGALGARDATLSIADEANTGVVSVALQGQGSIGYYQVDQYGDVANFGDAGYYEDAGSLTLNHPIVGITPTGDDGGYWLVASDGGVFTYGDAQFTGPPEGSP